MFVGIGVGIGRNRFAQGIFNAYNARVVADGGITEAGNCVNAVSSLLQSASLLIIPSGYKGGKAYAEIPTNGNGDLTWTRASDAWRTNADGLIQRVPWNLVTYSEQFDNAVWLKSSASITANATTAPDGTNSADKIIGVGNNPLIYQSTSTLTGKYTFSIYGKKGELSWLRLTNSSAGTNAVWFDLNNGAVGTIVGAGNLANITSVGNGWYRCEFIINSFDSSQITDLVIACTNADNTTTGYTGNSVDGLFIWGAQLVEGSSAQTYFPTTDRLNVPRLSYMYGSCPALLLEPQRTNLALYSEQFDNASWSKSNLSVTTNATTAPDGTTTADLLDDGTASNTQHWFHQGTTLNNSTTYTISFYAKYISRKYMSVNIYNGLTSQYVDYDIQNGTIFGSTGDVTATITSVGNNWYRCTYTRTVASVGTANYRIALADDTGSETYTGSNKQVYLWGAQIEAGAYPTTYIPTTTASATRIADSFSRSNIYTNGLITSSGGTWFVELRGNLQYTRDAGNSNLFIGDAGNNSPSNSLEIRNGGIANSRLDLGKRISGTFTTLYSTTTSTIKIAFKWNGTSVDVFVNGTKQVSASSFSITNMEFLYSQIQDVPRFIQAMALYPTPLSDTDCTTLTTL